jgi:hypothetical protein
MVLMTVEKRQVNIVGSSFQPGAGNWIAKLAPGQQLRVERERDNKYDADAVAVYIFQQKLGYFPRGFAAEVAPLMDAGYALSAIKSRNPAFAGTGVMVVEWEKPDVQGADAGEDQ